MVSSTESLVSSLVLKRAGIVEHFAVAVAEDVGGEPAVHAKHARLEAGRNQRLHERLTGLEVLAADGDVRVLGEFQQRGDVVVRFGAPLANGTPHHHRSVGVDLAEGAISGSLFFMPSSKLARVSWTAEGRWKTSVERTRS